MRRRLLAVALVGLALAASFAMARRLQGGRLERAKARDGEARVNDVLVAMPTKPVTVRGYAFSGDGFPLRLCDGRTSGAGRPHCVGPFLVLGGIVDESRLPMKRIGRDAAYTPSPVAVVGTMSRDILLVTAIVQ